MAAAPGCLEGREILAPSPTARNPGWLCGNVNAEQAGTSHPALCPLGRVCVCVYSHRGRAWETGDRGAKHLSESIYSGWNERWQPEHNLQLWGPS